MNATSSLLQGDETRRVGSTDTGATVPDRLVGDGVLTQVGSNHLTLKEEEEICTRMRI